MGRLNNLWALTVSVSKSVISGLKTNPDLRRVVHRHPRVWSVLKNRLNPLNFNGLPLTILVVIFFAVIALLAGVTESVLTSEPIVTIDVRIANLLVDLRRPDLVTFFWWITNLGRWPVILAVVFVSSVVLWRRHLAWYILPLWVTMLGTDILVALGKLMFHRPRPTGIIPLYHEAAFSFPSGHAAIAVAVYGFLLYLIWRLVRIWRWRLVVTVIGIGLIILVGFSRLYLGVHFWSDVWSGYLMGALWLILGMSWSEIWRSHHLRPSSLSSAVDRVIYSVLAIFLITVYVYAALYVHPAFATATEWSAVPTVVEPKNITQVFGPGHLPQFTETLSGHQQEPLSFIIIAPSDEVFVDRFAKGGWIRADVIDRQSLLRLSQAALMNKEYEKAPLTPSFWNTQVHEFGFQKPTPERTVRERHHARFWRTNLQTPDGQFVYVGTASLDTELKWVVTHQIDPDIDTEREVLWHDLMSTGHVAASLKQPFVKPTLGKNFAGDAFFTDGETYLLTFN